MICVHECPACEAVSTCYPPCESSGSPKLCAYCAASDACPVCEGAGVVMNYTANPMREDTHGHEEAVCPNCVGAL